ncbi:hypothetical protein QQP08_026352 [Theobroma cacao]|nr:hypothetical protein QQP08_024587 [Theobroma cacao]WRX33865.1 hypothetical protein QQP08_026352 [Theobroma cacao]
MVKLDHTCASNIMILESESIKENKLLQSSDIQVANGATQEDIYAVACLAIRCLRLKSKRGPIMKVATELEGLRNPHGCLEIHDQIQLVSDEILVHTGVEVGEESISMN